MILKTIINYNQHAKSSSQYDTFLQIEYNCRMLLHVHLVILNHHNCAATPVYFTNTCKIEQTTYVKKNVCGSFVLWLPLQEVYKYEIHASYFHILSGNTKRLNCSIYGNNILKSSNILSVVRIATTFGTVESYWTGPRSF